MLNRTMLNGLINLHDVTLLASKLRERGGRGMLAMIAGGRRRRIEDTWAHHARAPRSWWDIEQVRRRWNAMITGDPDIDPHRYVAAKYLHGGGLRGVSLGELQRMMGGGFDFDLGQVQEAAPLALAAA